MLSQQVTTVPNVCQCSLYRPVLFDTENYGVCFNLTVPIQAFSQTSVKNGNLWTPCICTKDKKYLKKLAGKAGICYLLCLSFYYPAVVMITHDANGLVQNQAFSKHIGSFLYLHDSCEAWVVWLWVVLFCQSRSAKQRWPWKLTASNGRIGYGCGCLIDKGLWPTHFLLPSQLITFCVLIHLQGGRKRIYWKFIDKDKTATWCRATRGPVWRKLCI